MNKQQPNRPAMGVAPSCPLIAVLSRRGASRVWMVSKIPQYLRIIWGSYHHISMDFRVSQCCFLFYEIIWNRCEPQMWDELEIATSYTLYTGFNQQYSSLSFECLSQIISDEAKSRPVWPEEGSRKPSPSLILARVAPETLLSLSRTLAPGHPNRVSTKMLKLPGMLRLPCRFQHNKNHKMHAVSSPSSIVHLPLVIFYNASIYLMPPLPRFQINLTSTTTEITAPWGPQLLVLRFDHCTVVPCYPTTSMPRSISNMFDDFGFHSAKF